MTASKIYQQLLRDVKENGVDIESRNGIRRRVFGRQVRFDLSGNKIPLVASHGIYVNGMIKETCWFLRGDTNADNLSADGVRIWDKWKLTRDRMPAIVKDLQNIDPGIAAADQLMMEKNITKAMEDANVFGSIGPMYGYQWRRQETMHRAHIVPAVKTEDIFSDRMAHISKVYEEMIEQARQAEQPVNMSLEQFASACYWHEFDQLNELVRQLRHNPNSSRLLVSAWNPTVLPFEGVMPVTNVILGRGALPPCHVMFQVFVNPPAEEGGKQRLSLQMYQRSCDLPVGFPFNIAQYSLIAHMLAQVCGMEAVEFIWSVGDLHIYGNQMELVEQELLVNVTDEDTRVFLNPAVTDLSEFTFDDVNITGYQARSDIKYPVSE